VDKTQRLRLTEAADERRRWHQVARNQISVREKRHRTTQPPARRTKRRRWMSQQQQRNRIWQEKTSSRMNWRKVAEGWQMKYYRRRELDVINGLAYVRTVCQCVMMARYHCVVQYTYVLVFLPFSAICLPLWDPVCSSVPVTAFHESTLTFAERVLWPWFRLCPVQDWPAGMMVYVYKICAADGSPLYKCRPSTHRFGLKC